MKFRTDFITNSSSSSFILGFTDENSIASELNNDISDIGYFEKVYEDCMRCEKMTIEEAIETYKKEIDSDITWDILRTYTYKTWNECVNIMDSDEFKEKVKNKIDKCVKEFKESYENKNIFVKLRYSDNDGSFYSELEHDIVPNLECCLKRFSHH